MKTCSQCKIAKELTNFKAHVLAKDKLHTWCKSCSNKYNREYRKLKPEQKRKDQALYRKRHPEKVNANAAKRDAAQKLRLPKWLTKEQLDQINQFYQDSSYLTQYTKVEFEVDHIVPILGKNVSGLHVPWNLQLLTATENNKKGNRL